MKQELFSRVRGYIVYIFGQPRPTRDDSMIILQMTNSDILLLLIINNYALLHRPTLRSSRRLVWFGAAGRSGQTLARDP